jgi:transmembrane sensor
MTPEQYILLYEKYLAGLCTPQEEEALMQYQDKFNMQDEAEPGLTEKEKTIRSRIYNRVVETAGTDEDKTYPEPARIVKLKWWWAAAAVVLLAVGVGTFINKSEQPQQVVDAITKPAVKPIKPGTNTAVLTLADGSTIILDKTANGLVARAGNTSIKKLKNGQLAYSANGVGTAVDPNALNTISIPRGGQYTVTLPDGTNVWLNSESSLTYPVAFTGDQRKVILKGEAYFEVAKNKKMPFIVHTDRADVNVLGTHFNVNAYADDSDVKTTLLEGSVRLSGKGTSALLVPGEQGIVDLDGISKKKVNLNQVIAWKLGYFVFRNNNIQDIMRQVSRWYDVEVEFRGNMAGKTFGGTYSKNKDINELLNGLELTGLIHFKIEGRRIIVMT